VTDTTGGGDPDRSRLRIRITKKADGSATLGCRRADGSETWQRHAGRQAAFFPLHDLTHYAVETVLGVHRGFWGLVAAGWDVTDFGRPWPRGPLPPQALASEFTVGFLDQERAAGCAWSAQDLNAAAATYLAGHGAPVAFVVSDEELRRIRETRRELFERWATLPAGEALELAFGPSHVAGSARPEN
jgi:hypothetical protein